LRETTGKKGWYFDRRGRGGTRKKKPLKVGKSGWKKTGKKREELRAVFPVTQKEKKKEGSTGAVVWEAKSKDFGEPGNRFDW